MDEQLPLREYWVFTPNIPKFLKQRGINFIGWRKRSDAIAFATLEAKKFKKRIEIKVADCPYPEDEYDFDNWKRCMVRDFAIVKPNGKVEILNKEVVKRKKK